MKRRRLLSGLGASALPFAGCVGSSEFGERETASPNASRVTTTSETTIDSETTDSVTRSFGRAFEAPSGATVTVHDVRVQRIVFTGGVHVDPYYRPGEQFLVADVSVSDRDSLRGFAVVVDGDRIDARRNDALTSPFDEPTDELLGFAVPAPLRGDRAALAWSDAKGGTARWPLDAAHLHALAHPPEFEVRGFEVPDEVEHGASFTADLTVANTGSTDGTFRAELGATTVSDVPEIRVDAPSDETVSVERTVDPHYAESADDGLTVVLNWSADRLKRSVEVAD